MIQATLQGFLILEPLISLLVLVSGATVLTIFHWQGIRDATHEVRHYYALQKAAELADHSVMNTMMDSKPSALVDDSNQVMLHIGTIPLVPPTIRSTIESCNLSLPSPSAWITITATWDGVEGEPHKVCLWGIPL